MNASETIEARVSKVARMTSGSFDLVLSFFTLNRCGVQVVRSVYSTDLDVCVLQKKSLRLRERRTGRFEQVFENVSKSPSGALRLQRKHAIDAHIEIIVCVPASQLQRPCLQHRRLKLTCTGHIQSLSKGHQCSIHALVAAKVVSIHHRWHAERLSDFDRQIEDAVVPAPNRSPLNCFLLRRQ